MTLAMRMLVASLVSLTTCSTMAGTSNYAGVMRPIAGTCDPTSQAVLTRRRDDIIFAPAGGTLLLHGNLIGQIATADLALTDPNKHAYLLAFRGHLEGKTITGTYTTPRCSSAVTLRLSED